MTDYYEDMIEVLDDEGMHWISKKKKSKAIIRKKGGPGSGHHGHRGRPGEVGGSLPDESIPDGSGLLPGVVTGLSREIDPNLRQAFLNELGHYTYVQDPESPVWKGFAYSGAHQSIERYRNSVLVDGMMVELDERGFRYLMTDENGDVDGEKMELLSPELLARQWAYSAGNHEYHSLEIQKAVAEEFGMEVSDYHVKNMIDMADWPSYKSNPHYGKDSPMWTEQEVMKAALRVMYNYTQSYFYQMGMKPTDTVTLYRGYAGMKDQPAVGTVLNWEGNTLDSWTMDPGIARQFGWMNSDGVVLAMKVPVSSIFSFNITGMGTFSEGEFVVFGNIPGTQVTVLENMQSWEHLVESYG